MNFQTGVCIYQDLRVTLPNF